MKFIIICSKCKQELKLKEVQSNYNNDVEFIVETCSNIDCFDCKDCEVEKAYQTDRAGMEKRKELVEKLRKLLEDETS